MHSKIAVGGHVTHTRFPLPHQYCPERQEVASGDDDEGEVVEPAAPPLPQNHKLAQDLEIGLDGLRVRYGMGARLRHEPWRFGVGLRTRGGLPTVPSTLDKSWPYPQETELKQRQGDDACLLGHQPEGQVPGRVVRVRHTLCGRLGIGLGLGLGLG